MGRVHVVVAVVQNPDGKILISQRPSHLHLGGFWEFPGGKLEAGETAQDALQRELKEEVGIEINPLLAESLTQIPFDYPEKSVLLDVWYIKDFIGEPFACEGQRLVWVEPPDLLNFEFPLANRFIVTKLALPNRYLVTGDFLDNDDFLYRLEHALKNGIRLVQLRAKHIAEKQFIELTQKAKVICDRHKASLILNTTPGLLEKVTASGVHLSSHHLYAYDRRPLPHMYWLIASCHNLQDLEQAYKIGVDAIVLGPVQKTLSHPMADTMGWDNFSSLVHATPIPVFAIGGMKDDCLSQAKACGAHGIAAIRDWWGNNCK